MSAPPDPGLPRIGDPDRPAALVDRCAEPLYLRYSRGPAHDRDRPCSRDYEAGMALPGLSVTPITPEPWWRGATRVCVARRICQYAAVARAPGRFGWALSGRVVGRGPDHEPLVVDVGARAQVTGTLIGQSADCYRSLFAIGRDSTDGAAPGAD